MKTQLQLLLIFTFVLLINNQSVAQAPSLIGQRCFGGTSADRASCIRQAADGGFIIVGYSLSTDGDVTGGHGSFDYWLVKTDSTDSIQWQKTLGGTWNDQATGVVVLPDGYVVCGLSESFDGDITNPHGATDYWIVKTDLAGNIIWQKSYGGTGYDEAQSITVTDTYKLIVTGYSGSNDSDVTGNHGAYDIWVLQLDSSGTLLSQKSYGGTDYDYGYNINLTNDGGYILTGQTGSYDGDVTLNQGGNDLWVIKADSAGNIEWQKTMGGPLSENGQCVKQTTDGGYIVAGYTSSYNGDVTNHFGADDYWIIKLDSAGGFTWKHGFGGTYSDYARDVMQTADGGYTIIGETVSNSGNVTGNHGAYDTWLLHLSSTGVFSWQLPLGGTFDDMGYSMVPTSHGIVIAGQTYSNNGNVSGNHGDFDICLFRLQNNTTGFNQLITSDNSISIEPNPAHGQCIISAEDFNAATISLSTADGKVVYSDTFHGTYKADLKKQQAGIYIVTISDDKKIASSRLVITD